MPRYRSLFLTLLIAAAPIAASAAAADFAGLVDIGGGRKIYLECRGAGGPAVVLVAGGKASAADWAMVFGVRNGEIASFRVVEDTAKVAAAFRR